MRNKKDGKSPWRTLICILLLLPGMALAEEKKPPAALAPLSFLGKVSPAQRQILFNRLEEKLSEKFDLISQQRFREAQDAAFQALDVEQCTEESCIRKIQEYLQVENLVILQILRDEGDTQLSLALIDLEKRTVKTDYCAKCGTRELNRRIARLVDRMLGGEEDSAPPPVAAEAPLPGRFPSTPPLAQTIPSPVAPRENIVPRTPEPPLSAPLISTTSVSPNRRPNTSEMMLLPQQSLGHTRLNLLASPRSFPPSQRKYGYGYIHNYEHDYGTGSNITTGYRIGLDGNFSQGLYSFYYNARDTVNQPSGNYFANSQWLAEYTYPFQNSAYLGGAVEGITTSDYLGRNHDYQRVRLRSNFPLGSLFRAGFLVIPAVASAVKKLDGNITRTGNGLYTQYGLALVMEHLTVELDIYSESANEPSDDIVTDGNIFEIEYKTASQSFEVGFENKKNENEQMASSTFGWHLRAGNHNLDLQNSGTVRSYTENTSNSTSVFLIGWHYRLGKGKVGVHSQSHTYETSTASTTRVSFVYNF